MRCLSQNRIWCKAGSWVGQTFIENDAIPIMREEEIVAFLLHHDCTIRRKNDVVFLYGCVVFFPSMPVIGEGGDNPRADVPEDEAWVSFLTQR